MGCRRHLPGGGSHGARVDPGGTGGDPGGYRRRGGRRCLSRVIHGLAGSPDKTRQRTAVNTVWKLERFAKQIEVCGMYNALAFFLCHFLWGFFLSIVLQYITQGKGTFQIDG